ncbi:hypothetical protein SAMN05660489_04362 [Pseudomonas sp. LAMO17WK12:I10]|uniref:hypothetical protein n=1 Tax=unclassified Pseudomonas TaxID=196821 RepID=UPI000BCE881A|nr:MULTISPECIES: hypothetical protein [unclassified Pseudomonas]PXX60712.1 hypothetical protein H160_04388 [Pseudomonas sp. LAMO17WK12:I9]SNY45435.1 hypothetical protein SAMN05660489_04362 [Pseudomonas sp. LAMO17WK12:I10]
MPKYILNYIRLCSECSFDLSTLSNMRLMVIPELQSRAAEIRRVAAMVPEGCPELEQDAELLESAVRAGLQRCNPQPGQQDLFAA